MIRKPLILALASLAPLPALAQSEQERCEREMSSDATSLAAIRGVGGSVREFCRCMSVVLAAHGVDNLARTQVDHLPPVPFDSHRNTLLCLRNSTAR